MNGLQILGVAAGWHSWHVEPMRQLRQSSDADSWKVLESQAAYVASNLGASGVVEVGAVELIDLITLARIGSEALRDGQGLRG